MTPPTAMLPRQGVGGAARRRHVVFVQHGDFRETCQRFAQGLPETYYAQRHSVGFVCGLRDHGTDVTVVCVRCGAYDEVLASGVRTVGCWLGHDITPRCLVRLLSRLEPTHVVLRTPMVEALRWCLASGVGVLPLLADSFNRRGVRRWLRVRRLVRLLNAPAIRLVANHNVPATDALKAMGVAPEKLVAWDWPHRTTPRDYPPKQGLSGAATEFLYVGAVTEAKGVGDCLRALPLLARRSPGVRLSIVGAGDVDRFDRLARRLGVASHVRWLGRVANHEIVPMMRASDVVLVPSRHEYPEGIPMTIYEALSARTPMVMSDHPMFASRFTDSVNAMLFRAGDPSSITSQVERLVGDQRLYEAISRNAGEAWDALQCQWEWSQLVLSFLEAPVESPFGSARTSAL